MVTSTRAASLSHVPQPAPASEQTAFRGDTRKEPGRGHFQWLRGALQAGLRSRADFCTSSSRAVADPDCRHHDTAAKHRTLVQGENTGIAREMPLRSKPNDMIMQSELIHVCQQLGDDPAKNMQVNCRDMTNTTISCHNVIVICIAC